MGVPARVAAPIERTAGNAVLRGALIALAVLTALLGPRWFPEYAEQLDEFYGIEWLGWIALLATTFWLIQNVRTLIDPIHHTAIARLARLVGEGRVAASLAKLSVELDGRIERFGTATLTTRHLLVETWSSYAIIPIDRIEAYREVEKDDLKLGFIPNGRIYRVQLTLQGGEIFDFDSSVRDHERVRLGIERRRSELAEGDDVARGQGMLDWIRDAFDGKGR